MHSSLSAPDVKHFPKCLWHRSPESVMLEPSSCSRKYMHSSPFDIDRHLSYEQSTSASGRASITSLQRFLQSLEPLPQLVNRIAISMIGKDRNMDSPFQLTFPTISGLLVKGQPSGFLHLLQNLPVTIFVSPVLPRTMETILEDHVLTSSPLQWRRVTWIALSSPQFTSDHKGTGGRTGKKPSVCVFPVVLFDTV